MAYELADGSLSTDYKIGDNFVVSGASTFKDGSIISFYKDDTTNYPLFKLIEGETPYSCCNDEAGAYTAWKNLKPYKEETDVKYKIELKKGDACEIKGLTEEQYRQVWDRFVADGAGVKNKRDNLSGLNEQYLEWWKYGNLVHTDYPESNAKFYTYNQIMEQENDMNTFSKKDLKTGMIIVTRKGDTGMVLLGTQNGDIVSGNTWFPLDSVNEDLTKGIGSEYDIVGVYQPKYNSSYLDNWSKPNLDRGDYIKLWERPAKETPEQKAQRELQEQYDATKKQLEELGKKLGVV